jgi:GDPmannose 4,6-dehydratase
VKYLVTGAAGQDGVLASRRLIAQGNQVYGLCKATQIEYLESAAPGITPVSLPSLNKQFIFEMLGSIQPEAIINFLGFSSVQKSWTNLEEVFELNTHLPIMLLEWIVANGPETRLLQAASSEMYGGAKSSPQDESTQYSPITPYGTSKVAANNVLNLFKNNHNLFISTAILYNHESPLRKPEFVTSHIINSLAKIKLGLAKTINLGNLEAKRDWGWAPDYVDGALAAIAYEEPLDFVFATGNQHSVLDFFQLALQIAGLGHQEKEILVSQSNERLADPINLVGNPAKAERILGWKRKVDFETMIEKMFTFEFQKLQNKEMIWFEKE